MTPAEMQHLRELRQLIDNATMAERKCCAALAQRALEYSNSDVVRALKVAIEVGTPSPLPPNGLERRYPIPPARNETGASV